MSIRFCFLFQFHTPGEIYLLTLLGYIYGPRLWIKKQPASSQTFHVFSVRSWRTARGLLRRTSTEVRHHASAFVTRRVQLVIPSLPRGMGLTPFSLRGSLHQQVATSSPAIRGGESTMTTCSPPSIGMARISPTVSPSQNWLWPWSDADRLSRPIRWRIGWPRLRPESWVRYLS